MRGRVGCFCPSVRPASPEYRALNSYRGLQTQTGNDRGIFAKICIESKSPSAFNSNLKKIPFCTFSLNLKASLEELSIYKEQS